MPQGKSFQIINPGKIPLESSILIFVLSLFTLPLGIGLILIPITGSYFIYQVIHWENHWIHVSRSKIVIHYLFSTVTISREEFTGLSLSQTKTGGNSILTLHTNSQSYRFGRVDNPDYLRKIFKKFKDETLFPDTQDTKIHPAKSPDTQSTPVTEHHKQETETKIHPAKLLDTQSTQVTEYYPQEILTESERKGRILEKSVFYSLISSDEIPGDHMQLWDLYIPIYDGKHSQIDVLMIHETGIYVFECKNHGGNIYGSVGNNTWAVFYPNGEKYNPPNPIRQNAGHINALYNYLNMQRCYFYSCVVLGCDACLKNVPKDDSRCFVSKYQNFERKLVKQIYNSPVHLSPDDIDRIYTRLEPLTKVSDEVKEKHKQDIREKYG